MVVCLFITMGNNLHKCESVNGETGLNKISWTCEACEFYHVEVLIKFHVYYYMKFEKSEILKPTHNS